MNRQGDLMLFPASYMRDEFSPAQEAAHERDRERAETDEYGDAGTFEFLMSLPEAYGEAL